MLDVSTCRELARQLRADSIRSTTAAGSGHPTSSMSAADLMAVLVMGHLRLEPHDPKYPDNDHLIFSKGHASPLLYALLKSIGVVDDQELMRLRTMGCRLEGHPTPAIPFVDAATGSLGQGLGVGVGIGLSRQYIEHASYRVWVLMGDSEMAEGSIWEAHALAAKHRVRNLISIVDVNRLGQRGPTMLEWDTMAYARRVESFGWGVTVIDGHDIAAIDAAYLEAERAEGPFCIVAHTIKGKGVASLANAEGWHGKVLTPDEAQVAIAEIAPPSQPLTIQPLAPLPRRALLAPHRESLELPTYPRDKPVATREAYGDALKALGRARSDIIVLDAEVSNSTYADRFAKAFPERYFEMYIAEQTMVNVAQGIAARESVVFISTFAAFLTRAHDQFRMVAVSRGQLRVCGSHAGVSIGEDGPSQMGLEDIALFRGLEGSTVFYPSDATSTVHLAALMADRDGISYLRTTREKLPLIYDPSERFEVGGSKLLGSSAHDLATIVAGGITVHEALAASARLKEEGVPVRVLDCYSVKPIDAETLRRCAEETSLLIVVEDHRPEGGLGEAVLTALASEGVTTRFMHLAVRGMPVSGTPQQLLERHGLSSRSIIDAIKQALAIHS